MIRRNYTFTNNLKKLLSNFPLFLLKTFIVLSIDLHSWSNYPKCCVSCKSQDHFSIYSCHIFRAEFVFPCQNNFSWHQETATSFSRARFCIGGKSRENLLSRLRYHSYLGESLARLICMMLNNWLYVMIVICYMNKNSKYNEQRCFTRF